MNNLEKALLLAVLFLTVLATTQYHQIQDMEEEIENTNSLSEYMGMSADEVCLTQGQEDGYYSLFEGDSEDSYFHVNCWNGTGYVEHDIGIIK